MQPRRITGAGAAARKYDILTALGTHALAADRSTQRRVLRLITLITARYNWQSGEMAIGRREIARLWSVDERTVKREIGALKALGFLTVHRPAARGRVTVYGLDLSAILAASEGDWSRVGPDFAGRMAEMAGRSDGQTPTVVPFPSADRSEWSRARTALAGTDRARATAWFAPLTRAGRTEGTLHLTAPSGFHADYVNTHLIGEITRAVVDADPTVHAVRVTAP